MPAGKSVIIIGSGLGGLQCGLILCRHGYRVTIVEKHTRPGGCLQSFVRGARFDCGFHYVGSMGEGEPLRILMDYYGLEGLPWKRLDEDCFDEICFVGEDSLRSYPHAMGFRNFVNRLSGIFPGSREELENYVSVLEQIGDNTFSSLEYHKMNPLFQRSALSFLEETVSDPLLRKVLSGSSLRMELSPELPLYVYAQIAGSFIRSAWRLEGGGDTLVSTLCSRIESLGGRIITGKAVISIECEDGSVKGVKLDDDEILSADYVISDIHPSLTISMIGEGGKLRNVYRKRMTSFSNTYGVFTANVRLKKDSFPYLNRNVYIHHEEDDLWRSDPSLRESVMVHFYPSEDGRYADRIDVMSPMDVKILERWRDLPSMKRGEEYEKAKTAKWEKCLSLLERRFPGIRDCIGEVHTSSPLTWLYYTGTPDGSAYGVRKDFSHILETVISPRTLVSGLLLTGQNLNLHGILGVSLTSILTCSEILGFETISKEISEMINRKAR